MAINPRKKKNDILQTVLRTLETQTSITATSPGSVARSIAEVITSELGDFYDLLDYNISQTLISTATGGSLDKIGRLYNVERNKLSEINLVDANTNTFYFYLDTPYHTPITIPAGTKIYSNNTSYVASQIRFEIPRDVVIPVGRRKVFAPLRASSSDFGITVGSGTLTVHDLVSPSGTSVKCTNPKSIESRAAYESDENYRTRIISEIRVNAGGTLTALRFSALKVQGVRDVRIAPARYGLGSMEMLVISETGTTSASVRGLVSAALEPVRPAGVRLYLKDPTRTEIGMNIGLIVPNIATPEGRDLVARVNLATTLYLNSLLPGDKLVYSQLLQRILDASDQIQDVRMINFSSNGSEVARTNYDPAYDEQVVPGEIRVSILS